MDPRIASVGGKMIRANSTSRRSAGFTLLELAVSMVILAILAAIVAPPWARYRARMRAYSSAHELRAELTYIQGRAIDLEGECWVLVDSTEQYSVFVTDPATGGGELYRRVNLAPEGLTLSSPGKRLTFGPRGWVDASKSDVDQLTGIYTITVSAPGVVDVPVRIYLNGRIEVR
jgi:prepilin-type N-terminal cleavage/methylation domain-containing protein